MQTTGEQRHRWAPAAVGDHDVELSHIIAPLAGLALAVTSWALRPDSRKLPGSLHEPSVSMA